jgi:hypothetical protein
MKKLSVVLIILGILGLLYFGWAQYRMGPSGMLDKKWPRPFPYPDTWLNALNNWYDARYPAHGYIKLHGEIFRVRATLSVILLVCAAMVAVGVAPSMLRLMKKRNKN